MYHFNHLIQIEFVHTQKLGKTHFDHENGMKLKSSKHFKYEQNIKYKAYQRIKC